MSNVIPIQCDCKAEAERLKSLYGHDYVVIEVRDQGPIEKGLTAISYSYWTTRAEVATAQVLFSIRNMIRDKFFPS